MVRESVLQAACGRSGEQRVARGETGSDRHARFAKRRRRRNAKAGTDGYAVAPRASKFARDVTFSSSFVPRTTLVQSVKVARERRRNHGSFTRLAISAGAAVALDERSPPRQHRDAHHTGDADP